LYHVSNKEMCKQLIRIKDTKMFQTNTSTIPKNLFLKSKK
jgi:hypothetical protein